MEDMCYDDLRRAIRYNDLSMYVYYVLLPSRLHVLAEFVKLTAWTYAAARYRRYIRAKERQGNVIR